MDDILNPMVKGKQKFTKPKTNNISFKVKKSTKKFTKNDHG